ncbi:MAG TPA: Xaa-Pro peptidase family protein [Thermohalobaculum sp.]|nr:Xaa-Pro peptidase family protein [Thermohalobaculum sp.]
MLHFTAAEFDDRLARTRAEMARRGLDALLLFAPESQFWLTGYDTFGFCFFQCLVVSERAPVLLTRSADLRQAQLTSTVEDIRIWKDRAGADPTADLAALIAELGLAGRRIGWETRTQGLVHQHGARLAARLDGVAELVQASGLMGELRLVKSPAEIGYVRRAAELADLAWDAAVGLARPGAGEAEILAAMQGAVLAAGGDYPGNEFIIGSGDHALLCRYQSGRRTLGAEDQLTLEWAGVWRRYHAALMKTILIGRPRPEHAALQTAAEQALLACEEALRPGRPMSEVFAAHAGVLDAAGLSAHRLNACGYSLGPRFSPSWMEDQMFYEEAPTPMAPGMVFFLHMIIMDSETGTAMTLGRTSLVTERGAEPLSRMPLGMVVG